MPVLRVQALSHGIRREQVFVHTGWRKLGGQWVYLHAGGAIGAGGPVAGLQVQLPEQLAGYELRVPQDSEGLQGAVRASLRVLDVGPDHITFPLLAAVYRAAIGESDFSLFATGPTGVFKSTLAALAQQHFGPGLAASNLPANFASTANALELLAFHAKDSLLVVDDFAPQGRSSDVGLQAIAERLFRAAGNRQARNRMKGGGLGPARPPRGLVLATGEEVPDGESIRGRMLIVEVVAGDVDVQRLGECQQLAAQGLFAKSTGGYIRWLAGRLDEAQRRMRQRVGELRTLAPSGAHARTPGTLAELHSGFEQFVEFAAESGAITPTEKAHLASRCWQALTLAATVQAKYQNAGDRALRFLALLRAAIATGQAHVADRHGGAPAEAETWGWRRYGDGWQAAGVKIGWVDGEDLLLDPGASFAVAQQVASSRPMGVSEQSVRARLHQRGLLVSVDARRETLKVRRRVEGGGREVLLIRVSEFRRADGLGLPPSHAVSC